MSDSMLASVGTGGGSRGCPSWRLRWPRLFDELRNGEAVDGEFDEEEDGG